MTRRFAQQTLVVFILVGGSATAGFGATQSNQTTDDTAETAAETATTTTIAGTISSLDVAAFNPRVIIAETNGKTTTVFLDSGTRIKAQNGGGQSTDLQVGQQVQIVGTAINRFGQYKAKAVTIAQSGMQSNAASSASRGSAAAPAKATAARPLRSVEAQKPKDTQPEADSAVTPESQAH